MPRAYDFHYFSVRNIAGYGFIVDRPPAAVVVPESPDGRLWMVQVRRPPTRTLSWELPGGGIGPRETPRQAALRELEEECGLTTKRAARVLPTVYEAAPGMGRMPHYVIVARDVVPISRRAKPQREEGIERVRAITRATLRRLVRSGEIHVFATLSALAATGWLTADRRRVVGQTRRVYLERR
jgi:8-oxo-dGTP pyrophosphatase MutT (NUDIX family)